MLGTEGVVTEEIIDSLYQECKDYRPDMLTVLDVVSPSYFLDDKPESNRWACLVAVSRLVTS